MFFSHKTLFLFAVISSLLTEGLESGASLFDQSVFVMKIIHTPYYHISAPNGWLNDPSAFVSYKGRYHIFYQSHPLDRARGPSQWGHVVSLNLVDWYHFPYAIGPKDDYDRDGCLSGSAIVHRDYLTLFYTGLSRQGEEIEPTQNIAVSSDGIVFVKYPYNPIIYEGLNGTGEFRHPKVWHHREVWYMMVGSQTPDKHGCVILYTSPDLISWYYQGIPAQSTGDMGFVWENPDLVEFGTVHVLIVSIRGFIADGYKSIYHTVYVVCQFNYTTLQFDNFEFSRNTYNQFDYGHDFYGAQTSMKHDGTRLLVAWLGSWDTYYGGFEDGYASQMTMIREIRLTASGKLLSYPAQEYASLRSSRLEEGWFNPGDKFRSYARAYEMIVNASSVREIVIVNIQWGDRKQFKITYNSNANSISIDRGGKDGMRSARWYTEELNLRIFIDVSSAEVYCGNGEVVFSSRIYPRGKTIVSISGDTQIHIVQYKLRKSIKYFFSSEFANSNR